MKMIFFTVITSLGFERKVVVREGWAQLDLNQRPRRYQRRALTT